MTEIDCYEHYLERYRNMIYNANRKDNSEIKTKKIKNNQLHHMQFFSQHCQLLGSPHHYHYLNHLPFGE